MIVQLFRPEGGGDRWLLYAPDLPGGVKPIRAPPELAAMLEGPSGYFYAEPEPDSDGWTISGRAPPPVW